MHNRLLKTIKKIYRYCFGSKKPTPPVDVERAKQIFYIKYLREGMIVFDVGAHVGELSLLFSHFMGPTGKVYYFEASRSVFEKLTKVCQLVGRPQIKLNHKAITGKVGIVKLYVYDEEHSTWSSLADRSLKKYGIDVKPTHIEEVGAVTIYGYCNKSKISRIDLLKIDVKGAEYQVLLGARQMLKSQSIRCCVFEFGATSYYMGNEPGEIEFYLTQFGYRIRNLVKGDPVFPGRSSGDEVRFSVHVARPGL